MKKYFLKEDFLHYIWQTQNFNSNQLQTTDHEDLTVYSAGLWNHNAGPDFLNARLKIGDAVWHGHVEIHIDGADWYNHKHDRDPAYNNVILHVVFNDNRIVTTEAGHRISTLILKNRIEPRLMQGFEKLKKSINAIPCESQIEKIDFNLLQIHLEYFAVERLNRKCEHVSHIFENCAYNWEETLWSIVFANMGFKVNAFAFNRLWELLPPAALKKCYKNTFQMESLLFGIGGFLNAAIDTYSEQLMIEYEYLKQVFQCKQMQIQEWRFSRMRPQNFPFIRIAQLTHLLRHYGHLFEKLKSCRTIEEIRMLLNAKPSAYWKHHYRFGYPSKFSNKNLGLKSMDLLILNSIIPLLFFYSKKTGNSSYGEYIFNLMENIKSEKNGVIKKWNEMGIQSGNAKQSQALIQLKKEYCDQKRCAYCRIGHMILKN